MYTLLQKLVTQPGLFAEHAGAYAELAALEAQAAALAWRRRLAWLVAAAVLACTALVLSGVAVLLQAALPSAPMPSPSTLLWLPLGTWAAAALCAWAGWRAAPAQPFAHLREQWRADLQLLREASGSS